MVSLGCGPVGWEGVWVEADLLRRGTTVCCDVWVSYGPFWLLMGVWMWMWLLSPS